MFDVLHFCFGLFVQQWENDLRGSQWVLKNFEKGEAMFERILQVKKRAKTLFFWEFFSEKLLTFPQH